MKVGDKVRITKSDLYTGIKGYVKRVDDGGFLLCYNDGYGEVHAWIWFDIEEYEIIGD